MYVLKRWLTQSRSSYGTLFSQTHCIGPWVWFSARNYVVWITGIVSHTSVQGFCVYVRNSEIGGFKNEFLKIQFILLSTSELF